MSLFTWWTQRVGALSLIALLALTYYVISKEISSRNSPTPPPDQGLDKELEAVPKPKVDVGTALFAYYSLFVHVLVIFFPIRSCWAIWGITKTLKRKSRAAKFSEFWPVKKLSIPRRSSGDSAFSGETLHLESPGGAAAAASFHHSESLDLGSFIGQDAGNLDSVVHAIVIPNYKEEVDVLRETLDVLASHPRARNCYDIYLGMEEREANGTEKALGLIQMFVKSFRSIDFTTHPAGIPGESAGKGSNLGWAARKLSEKYPMSVRENVIVTGIDADSHLAADYFSTIADMHLAEPETSQTALYTAPIVFDRNAQQVTGLVRVADILWCAAGISGLYKGSTICPPTSVYSLPLQLVDRVGGWDCDSEAIGEDLHMYIKCFFALNGNLTCRHVLSPVSSSNVCGTGAGGLRGTASDMKARYKQAIRHMWGSLDTGYTIRKSVEMWKNRKHTTRAFQPLHRQFADSPELYVPEPSAPTEAAPAVNQSGIFSEVNHSEVKSISWEHVYYLYVRLFEAHFMPVHMAVLILGSAIYLLVLEDKDQVSPLAWTFEWSRYCRTFGCMSVAIFIFLYESYHRLCVTTREREMVKAGLADGMCFAHRTLRANFVDYLLIPFVAPVFGTVPCLQAEISHLWTTELVYTVSRKVTRQRAKSTDAADMA